MTSSPPATRVLVLVGAGHTHMHVLRQWRRRPISDVRLTLITPFRHATYSGMLPGTLAGLYGRDAMQIDLCRLTEGTGMRLLVAEATGLDPHKRLVTFDDQPDIHFDVASVGIGSVPNRTEVWSGSSRVLSIKPMATFLDRLDNLMARTNRPGRPLHCAVVGGGAAGTEISFCLDAMLRTRRIPHQLLLLDHHAEILAGYSRALIQRARRLLERRGIEILLGQAVMAIEETAHDRAQLTLGDATTRQADIIIWATSATASRDLAGYALPKDANGFLTVHSTLQSTADVPVFVVGDSASFVSQQIPKAGVYAVREGPILWQNIQRYVSHRPLIPFQPQSSFMSLLSTGDGKALMQYHGWTAYGSWTWWLKDWIDRRFVRQYQDF
jgi:selenide,water dikinase